jgi:hypothetical protein
LNLTRGDNARPLIKYELLIDSLIQMSTEINALSLPQIVRHRSWNASIIATLRELRDKMERKDIPFIEDMHQMAQLEKVKLLACKTSADLFDLTNDNFLEGVEITQTDKRHPGWGITPHQPLVGHCAPN